MPPRAGDADVEQGGAPRRAHRLIPRTTGGWAGCLPPGRGQEDGVPLESLGPMERRERDAVAARVGLGGIAPRQLVQEVDDRGGGPLKPPVDRAMASSVTQRGVPIARLGAGAGRASASSKPSSLRHRFDLLSARAVPSPPALVSAARAAGPRGGRRSGTPRTVKGISAAVSAASNGDELRVRAHEDGDLGGRRRHLPSAPGWLATIAACPRRRHRRWGRRWGRSVIGGRAQLATGDEPVRQVEHLGVLR